MRKDIPTESYWKLRSYAIEMELGNEKRAHLATLLVQIQKELGTCTAKYEELKAEVGGEIGMEGKPEDWHVQLDGEDTSWMEKGE